MKVLETVRVFVSGCIVYGMMAACSAAGHSSTGGGDGGSVGGQAGNGGSAMGGGDGGIWDAMMDPVGDASADPVSGSRLKAKFRVASDGSKEYLPSIWYDSQRDEDCSFKVAEDGQERCLPQDKLASVGVFSDASCTKSLGYTTSGCKAAKYASATDPNACYSDPLPVTIYSLAGTINPAKIYSLSGGNCVAYPPPAGYTIYSLGAKVPASSFASGTVSHD